MKLPDAESAYVDREKVADYLLSLSPPDGRSKALFFMEFGYDSGNPDVLADALCTHGQAYDVNEVVESEYGLRYTVDGALEVPDGRNPSIRTVWIVEVEGKAPRLITAHPI